MPRSDKPLQPKLKGQLQKKSAARRSRNAAETRVIAASAGPTRNDIQPELACVRRPVAGLKPSANRTRITAPDQLARVINSMRQFGNVQPILIDAEDYIVSGHVQWEAARELGLTEIECVTVTHLNKHELEALAIALNRLGETGSFDLDILRVRMIEIRDAGISLESTGFTVPEIDQIVIGPACEEAVEASEDEAPPEANHPVTVEGDLFCLGGHRLLCGDSLKAASYQQVLDGREAHAVFSDSPYNCPIAGFVSGLGKTSHDDFQMACGEMDDQGFTNFLSTYLGHCRDCAAKGAIIFACMDWRQIDLLLTVGRTLGLRRKNKIIWNKGSGAMGSLYRAAYEEIAVFCTDNTPATNNVELGVHGRDRTNVWTYPGANRRGSSAAAALADHPTPKPVELVEDALLDVTNPGDVVLDPFLGSGTTLIAAERCDRICCGIELDPKYVEVIIRRWEALTGEEAVHAETAMTFAELREHRGLGVEQD